jgi:sugar lactone lactonase YvrE
MRAARPFVCVRCGAPLVLPQDPSVVEVACSFCRTQTPVPAEHIDLLSRGRVAALNMSPGSSSSAARSGCVVAVAVVLALLVMGGFGAFWFARRTGTAAVTVSVAPATVTAIPAVTGTRAAAAPTLGSKLSSFGGKGSGAGLYEDARTIAVAADGTVYVGEYDSGRVHQFDAAGTFVRVIDVPASKDGRKYLFGLATDTTGALYVSRANEIVKLGPAGAIVATIPERPRKDRQKAAPGEMCAQAIALDASNRIYTASDCTPEGLSTNIESPYSIVKLDATGKQLGHWKDAGVDGARLAVDGDGTMFIAGETGTQVAVYDAAGKLSTKWGQRGSDPGDFSGSIDALAVDGHGHVLVLASDAIQVYDATGKYRGRLGEGGSGNAIAAGPKGVVYVLRNGGPVDEYQLSL